MNSVTLEDLKDCKTLHNLECRINKHEVYIGDSVKFDFYTTKQAYWKYRKNRCDATRTEFLNKVRYNGEKLFGALAKINQSFEDVMVLWKEVLSSFIRDEHLVNYLIKRNTETYKVFFDFKDSHMHIMKNTTRGNGKCKYKISYRKQIHASKDVYKTSSERIAKEKEVLKKYVYAYFKEIGFIDENNKRTIGAKKAYATLKNSNEYITGLKVPACSISYELITDIYREYKVGTKNHMMKREAEALHTVEAKEETVEEVSMEGVNVGSFDVSEDVEEKLEDIVYNVLPTNTYAWNCMRQGYIDTRRDSFRFRRIIKQILDSRSITLDTDCFEDLIAYCKDPENVKEIYSSLMEVA